MSATDELRRLLDERGVEWWETVNNVNCVFTWWESPTFGTVQAMDNEDGETLFMACLNNCDFTPEQAIAATLGGGECNVSYEQDGIPRCSVCENVLYDEYKKGDGIKNYCDECGARIRKAVKR